MSKFQKVTLSVRVLLIALLSLPILAGLIGVLLPAFGYFPALDAHDFSFDVFGQLFAVDGIFWMSWLSFSTGIISTLLASIGAVVLAAAFYRHAWLNKIQHLLSPLLVIPHAAAAIAFLFMVAPSGWLARVFTGWGGDAPLPPQWALPYDEFGISIILALALKELPFLFLMMLSVMAQPQLQSKIRGYVRSAENMGYSPATAFMKVAVPVIYPYIRLPLLAVLAYATANVEMPLILGPNNPPTLAVAILQWFNHVDLDMRFQASAGAVLQLVITLLALACWWLGERLLTTPLSVWKTNGQRSQLARTTQYTAHATLLTFVGVGFFMLLSVLLWSFATYWPYPNVLPQGFTTLHWSTAQGALADPLINTLLLGVTVSFAALVIVLFALEAETLTNTNANGALQKLDKLLIGFILYLPLLVPGVAFLFGLVWFQQVYFADAIWTSAFITHLIYVLPYVFIALAVAYRRLDVRYIKVASGLGKSPIEVFVKVKLPMLFAPIMVAFALGLAISYSQYLPTLLSTGGQIATLTTEAVAVASGNSGRLSAVYVVVQIILPLLGFVLAWWLPKVLFNPAARGLPFQRGSK